VTGSLVAVREDLHLPTLEDVAEEYVRAGDGDASARCRRQGVTRFIRSFGTLAAWNAAPAAARMRVRTEVVSFAAFAAVRTRLPVEPIYVVASGCRWGKYQAAAYPAEAAGFHSQAMDLGFCGREVDRMWAHLSRIAMIAGAAPHELTAQQYTAARAVFHDTVIAVRGTRPQTLSTPLFGLDAVMFHRGQAPRPEPRRRWTGRPVAEVDWGDIAVHAPLCRRRCDGTWTRWR